MSEGKAVHSKSKQVYDSAVKLKNSSRSYLPFLQTHFPSESRPCQLHQPCAFLVHAFSSPLVEAQEVLRPMSLDGTTDVVHLTQK